MIIQIFITINYKEMTHNFSHSQKKFIFRLIVFEIDGLD